MLAQTGEATPQKKQGSGRFEKLRLPFPDVRELPRCGLLMMLHEARTDLAMLASLVRSYRYRAPTTSAEPSAPDRP
jgi:hypothetical protein